MNSSSCVTSNEKKNKMRNKRRIKIVGAFGRRRRLEKTGLKGQGARRGDQVSKDAPTGPGNGSLFTSLVPLERSREPICATN